MGEYADGAIVDITANSQFGFELDDTNIGEFAGNILTINSDAAEGTYDIFGKCNRIQRLFEVTVQASTF